MAGFLSWITTLRPAVCWLSLPRRAHKRRGLVVFPVPVEPAYGRGDVGSARHLGHIRLSCEADQQPAVGPEIRPRIRQPHPSASTLRADDRHAEKPRRGQAGDRASSIGSTKASTTGRRIPTNRRDDESGSRSASSHHGRYSGSSPPMIRSPTFSPAARTKTRPSSFVAPTIKHSPCGMSHRRGHGRVIMLVDRRHSTHCPCRYCIDDKLTRPQMPQRLRWLGISPVCGIGRGSGLLQPANIRAAPGAGIGPRARSVRQSSTTRVGGGHLLPLLCRARSHCSLRSRDQSGR
jgi:hypothetical protein